MLSLLRGGWFWSGCYLHCQLQVTVESVSSLCKISLGFLGKPPSTWVRFSYEEFVTDHFLLEDQRACWRWIWGPLDVFSSSQQWQWWVLRFPSHASLHKTSRSGLLDMCASFRWRSLLRRQTLSYCPDLTWGREESKVTEDRAHVCWLLAGSSCETVIVIATVIAGLLGKIVVWCLVARVIME